MNVREATEEDIEGIRRVAEAAWRTDYAGRVNEETIESGVERWYSDPVVRMELSNPGTDLRVAEKDDEIIGFVHAHRSGPVGTILRLHVDPAHRKAGIEEDLYEAIATDFEAESEGIRATALAANSHMQEFYETRGFEHVDTDTTTIGETQYDETVLERT
ncbi:MAG: GNAT family N-acetyltransferase [Halodesulfurarchaeum sp.]|nr:GNAT family N-acetyltransferase [Halodesulfurarchaeum sp.]